MRAATNRRRDRRAHAGCIPAVALDVLVDDRRRPGGAEPDRPAAVGGQREQLRARLPEAVVTNQHEPKPGRASRAHAPYRTSTCTTTSNTRFWFRGPFRAAIEIRGDA